MNTETPLTDKAHHDVIAGGSFFSFPEHARTMERAMWIAVRHFHALATWPEIRSDAEKALAEIGAIIPLDKMP